MKFATTVTSLVLIIALFVGGVFPVLAAENPLDQPNNKFGMHIISATNDEIEPVRELVNTNGDWGYITLLIESKDRNIDKWQQVFNNLRRKHLIPIVRIATEPVHGYWRRPDDNEGYVWAEFLSKLNWPTKNRYVIVYNEPNHATEWGNTVDAKHYARVLDNTITALKQHSADYFVMNAGFDASAPQKLPAYQDQLNFMKQMEEEVPGIFEKIDGWSSHSYPNPAFKGLPTASGRITVRGYQWELDTLKNTFNVKRDLPVFITETGWKHSEGKVQDNSLPSVETVAEYYKNAFENAWNDERIVAVTPFILNYQDSPFDHFSFKKVSGKPQKNLLIKEVLGAESESNDEHPDYHPQYNVLKQMSKIEGRPIQEYKAQITQTNFLKTAVVGEVYTIQMKVKNIGQSIWNEYDQIKLIANEGAESFGFSTVEIPKDTKVEPGQEYTFYFPIRLDEEGEHRLVLALERGGLTFNSTPFTFDVKVTTPSSITIQSGLAWKRDPSGEYTLTISGVYNNTIKKIFLNNEGKSDKQELKMLIPNYTYDFTLSKPNYKPQTVRQKIQIGDNFIDFGELQPDITSAILRPDVILQFISN